MHSELKKPASCEWFALVYMESMVYLAMLHARTVRLPFFTSPSVASRRACRDILPFSGHVRKFVNSQKKLFAPLRDLNAHGCQLNGVIGRWWSLLIPSGVLSIAVDAAVIGNFPRKAASFRFPGHSQSENEINVLLLCETGRKFHRVQAEFSL